MDLVEQQSFRIRVPIMESFTNKYTNRRGRNGHHLFSVGGKRIVYSSSPNLEKIDGCHPILEIAGSANWNRADRNLYVVELKPKIFEWETRFFEANLHWIPGKLCVYVGVTGLTPEERFRKHAERAGQVHGKACSAALLPVVDSRTETTRRLIQSSRIRTGKRGVQRQGTMRELPRPASIYRAWE